MMIATRQLTVVLDTGTADILRARAVLVPVFCCGRTRSGVCPGELSYDVSLPERAVDVWAHRLEMSLGLCWGHATVRHEPAQCDRGAAPAPRLAVNVDRVATASMGFDEIDRPLDIVQGRRCEIQRRCVQLLDAVAGVALYRTSVFDAGVDDGAYARGGHVVDQPGQR